MLISKFRDLVLIELSCGKILSVACDSCGGIGNSELDQVKIDEETVGYLATRVCLFETLSFRAIPQVIVNNLCVEMDGRGKKILSGIKRAIEEYNSLEFEDKLDENNITGSTEENIKTLQTAFGITILGEEDQEERFWDICDGDTVIAIGKPLVGDEVVSALKNESKDIVSMKSLKTILDYSKDVLPVGSSGINGEVVVLEETNGIKVIMNQEIDVDLKKSSGPSTTVLAIVEDDMLEKIKRKIQEDITIIGKVKLNN